MPVENNNEELTILQSVDLHLDNIEKVLVEMHDYQVNQTFVDYTDSLAGIKQSVDDKKEIDYTEPLQKILASLSSNEMNEDEEISDEEIMQLQDMSKYVETISEAQQTMNQLILIIIFAIGLVAGLISAKLMWSRIKVNV